MDKKYINKTKNKILVLIEGKYYSTYRLVRPGGYVYTRENAKVCGEGMKRV